MILSIPRFASPPSLPRHLTLTPVKKNGKKKPVSATWRLQKLAASLGNEGKLTKGTYISRSTAFLSGVARQRDPLSQGWTYQAMNKSPPGYRLQSPRDGWPLFGSVWAVDTVHVPTSVCFIDAHQLGGAVRWSKRLFACSSRRLPQKPEMQKYAVANGFVKGHGLFNELIFTSSVRVNNEICESFQVLVSKLSDAVSPTVVDWVQNTN